MNTAFLNTGDQTKKKLVLLVIRLQFDAAPDNVDITVEIGFFLILERF